MLAECVSVYRFSIYHSKVRKSEKKFCFYDDVKILTVGLCSIFWYRGARTTFFAFSFMLGECTNLFWKWHGCKKQLCHHQWGSAPFLFPSSFSVWNSMSYNISLLDLLANTGCHCMTSSSAGDKNTDEQLVTHNLERWPEHSQGDSQAVTSVSQANMSTCSK